MFSEITKDGKVKYCPTKGDIVKAMGLDSMGEYDYALPEEWVDNMAEKLNPYGIERDSLLDCVWLYPRNEDGISFGRPFPLTEKAAIALIVLAEHCRYKIG